MSDSDDMKRPDDELNQGAQEVVRILRWFFGGLTVVMIAVVIYYFVSGIFILESGKHAAIYRFGRLVEPIKEKQDWYWSWPKHVDERKEVEVLKPTTIICDYFWYKEDPRNLMQQGAPSKPGTSLIVGEGGYHLTADNNVMHSKWSLDYVVNDLKSYLTRCTNSEFLIRTTLRNAVVKASGQLKIDEILNDREGRFTALVKHQVIRDVTAMAVGVKVVKVNLDAKAVPRAVKSAFDDVTNAGNEQDKFIQDAHGYANRQRENARAQGRSMKEDALAYRQRIEDSVVADANYMEKILPEFRKHGASILLNEYTNVLLKVVEGASQVVVISPDQEVRIRIEPRLEPQAKKKLVKDEHGEEH